MLILGVTLAVMGVISVAIFKFAIKGGVTVSMDRAHVRTIKGEEYETIVKIESRGTDWIGSIPTTFAIETGQLIKTEPLGEGRIKLRFFGKYSYGLYVYHGLLTWYFLERRMGDRIGAALGHHSLAIAVTAAFGIGASLVIAVLSYEMFEKRFLQLKRFFEAGHELAAPAAAPRIAGVPEP